MESQRFYTSPVNHHDLDDWKAFGARLETAVGESSDGVTIKVGQEPVFGYDAGGDDALEAVAERNIGRRQVRVELWSSIVFYETLSLTFGSGVKPQEQSAIVARLEAEELADQTFLRAHEGPYDEEAVQVYGYAAEGLDENGVEMLLVPFDGPIYIGRRSLVLVENDEVDDDFEILEKEGDVTSFLVQDSRAEMRLWDRARQGEGEGLIVLYPDDPATDELLRRFGELEDLRILLREHPSANMRVTLGRCHADDSLVVVYAPPGEPEIDQPLLFAI